MLDRKLFCGHFHSRIRAFSWKVFGWQSKRYLKKYSKTRDVVFHVRSGAGHGGAIRLAHKLGIPVIVDHSIAHPVYMEENLRSEFEKNGMKFDLGVSSPFWRLIVEDCEWADVLLVNSLFVRDTFVEQGYPAEKIKVVYLGTRPDFFGLRNVRATERGGRKMRLLFTGGFGFRKGAEYILDAIRILIDKAPVPFEMDIVGDFCGAKALIEKYKNDNLPVVFHGPVPQDDLKRFLAQSDIYVFPSLAEGCACSGMEAMAAGLCVVATHEAGLPIEDGVNGCIVPSKDASAVAEKILHLMARPEDVDQIGTNASKLIQTRYTWELYAQNVTNIYKDLLK